MSDVDLFRISEDHEALREAVRAVVQDKVAPYAASVDDESRFPQEAYDALRAGDFHAPHIPEQYDGAGLDALATCIVIEEVARACASSSLIPAVNKLGTMPLILGAGRVPAGRQRRAGATSRSNSSMPDRSYAASAK